MKKLVLIVIVAVSLTSCAKEDFAPEKPQIVKSPDQQLPPPSVIVVTPKN